MQYEVLIKIKIKSMARFLQSEYITSNALAIIQMISSFSATECDPQGGRLSVCVFGFMCVCVCVCVRVFYRIF